MYCAKWDVFRITEMRNGAVYKTARVTHVWLAIKPRTEEERYLIAKRYGGDILAATMETEQRLQGAYEP